MRNSMISRWLSFLLIALILIGCAACAEGTAETPQHPDERNLDAADYTLYNLAATDDYDRSFTAVKSKKRETYVGIFYFVHLGFHGNHKGIYDISEMAEDNYAAFFRASVHSVASPVGMAHYFAQPMWGYYDSDDEWVMRRQIEMLTLADVDFLALDTTNDELYPATVGTLLRLIKEYRAQGWDAPQVLFYINANAAENTRKAYELFYRDRGWDDCWFAPNGKPLIVTVTEQNDGASDQGISKAVTDRELLDFFEVKESQWPNTKRQNENGVPWMDFSYPQKLYRGETGNWINVSVAQHSETVTMSDLSRNRGRGYRYRTEQFDAANNDGENFRAGINFDYQWKTVHDRAEEIDYVLITGWNEWVAQKNNRGSTVNPVYTMVDLFNEEYSRDIEPMRGGYGDNFYLQMMQNIRALKYENYDAGESFDAPYVTIDPDRFDEAQWADCKAVYLDFKGECMERNADGFPGAGHYSDQSNRNDFVQVTVARDAEYLYFRIETAAEITARQSGDTTWMNLLIGTENGGAFGPLGLQYVVNRTFAGSRTNIMRYSASDRFEIAGEGEYRVRGNIMQLKLPLSAFSFGDDVRFRFKLIDHVGNAFDPIELYAKGDSAPVGRLTYVYGG